MSVAKETRLDRVLGLSPEERRHYDRRYLVYLIAIAVAGWALASYDFNLLVMALPTIAKSLHMSQTQVGLLAFLVYAAMFVISLAIGYSMGRVRPARGGAKLPPRDRRL